MNIIEKAFFYNEKAFDLREEIENFLETEKYRFMFFPGDGTLVAHGKGVVEGAPPRDVIHFEIDACKGATLIDQNADAKKATRLIEHINRKLKEMEDENDKCKN